MALHRTAIRTTFAWVVHFNMQAVFPPRVHDVPVKKTFLSKSCMLKVHVRAFSEWPSKVHYLFKDSCYICCEDNYWENIFFYNCTHFEKTVAVAVLYNMCIFIYVFHLEV